MTDTTPETEGQTAQGASSGGWLETLLNVGLGAFQSVEQTKQAKELQKYQAAANMPSVAQPAAQSSLTTPLLIGGGIAVAVVVVLLLTRKQ